MERNNQVEVQDEIDSTEDSWEDGDSLEEGASEDDSDEDSYTVEGLAGFKAHTVRAEDIEEVEVETSLPDEALKEEEPEPVEVLDGPGSLTDEEAETLDAGEADDLDTPLGVTFRELKTAIRQGQFNPDDLAAITENGLLSEDQVEILLAHPLEMPKKSQAPKSEKAKASKKVPAKTAMSSTVTRIVDLLVESPHGLTIDEICVQLGVLTEDANPQDSEVKIIKKQYRTLARRAVDNHPEGHRDSNLGRNRLYVIGDKTRDDEGDDDEE